MSPELELAIELINRQSVTPDDNGCQQIISKRLEKIGFKATPLRFAEVDNLWITHGDSAPLFVFAGHTDVVPAGLLTEWQTEPFTATVIDDYLYGRGAADMKGGIAAMVIAAERFIRQHPTYKGSIAFLLTSDEEGPAINGTRKIIDYLNDQQIKIDWCIVGEPSSDEQLADTIKIGRRGSLNGVLTIKGVQGHVAYPAIADNPIHRASAFLAEITAIKWDMGNAEFPPTSFQISNIHAGSGAENVIPSNMTLLFNFRYSTETTHLQLQDQVTALLEKYGLNYDLQWRLSGEPFLTSPGRLIASTCQAIKEIIGIETVCATGGGTSDARFIAPTGAEVIELGVVNKTIHKINEYVKIDDLNRLAKIYQNILKRLLID